LKYAERSVAEPELLKNILVMREEKWEVLDHQANPISGG